MGPTRFELVTYSFPRHLCESVSYKTCEAGEALQLPPPCRSNQLSYGPVSLLETKDLKNGAHFAFL